MPEQQSVEDVVWIALDDLSQCEGNVLTDAQIHRVGQRGQEIYLDLANGPVYCVRVVRLTGRSTAAWHRYVREGAV